MDTPVSQAPSKLIESRRASEELAVGRPLANAVLATPVDAGGVPARLFVPDGVAGGPVVLYCHGGGFRQGSVTTYATYTSHLAALTGLRVLSVGYRLAPEHPFPAGVDDAVAAYRWLVDSEPEGTPVLLAGDSAGGGIVACLLLETARQGLPRPVGLGLVSPWLDLRLVAESHLLDSDLVFPLVNAREAADMYLQGQDPSDPRVSPLLADWSGQPPIFVAASHIESLRDDSASLARIARDAGVEVEDLTFADTAHGWWMEYPATDDSRRVVEALTSFLSRVAQAHPS